MKIQNLDHVSVVSTSEISGGGKRRGRKNKYSSKTKIKFVERLDIFKKAFTFSKVHGTIAFSKSDAEAYGHDTNAETGNYTYTQPGYSSAGGYALSQSN